MCCVCIHTYMSVDSVCECLYCVCAVLVHVVCECLYCVCCMYKCMLCVLCICV